MGREIRKQKYLMPEEMISELLQAGSFGVMASVGEEGQPLATPIYYVWHQGCVCIHCGVEGHKIDNLRHDNRVSFVVVGRSISPEERCESAFYQSVMVNGRAELVTDEAERVEILTALCQKYFNESPEESRASSERAGAVTLVYKIIPDQMTGKLRTS